MSIPSSGQIKFSDLQTEFGGSNPIGLSEYYAGAGYVAPGTTGTSGSIPSSGNPLNIGKFFGSAAAGVLWGSRFLKAGASNAQVDNPTVRYLNGRFFALGSTGNPTSIIYSTDSTATSWLTTSVGNGTYFGPAGAATWAYTPVLHDIASNGTTYVTIQSLYNTYSATIGVVSTSKIGRAHV